MPEHNILLVDDSPTILQALKSDLGRAGMRIDTCHSIAEAIDMIRSHGPGYYQCVTTDYEMPGGTGIDLLRWIREIDQSLAVIILTGLGAKDLIQASLRLGVSDFIEKPVTSQTLLPAVTLACQKTIQARQLYTMQKSVRSIAHSHYFFKSILVPQVLPYIQLHYTPHEEVGGDFINIIPIGDTQTLILVGDVSGHDLRAGFVSAYFQGLVRGLCYQGKGILDICQAFNKILVEEWERKSEGGNPFKVEPRTTLSLLAIQIDNNSQTATVVGCGAPALKLAYRDGHVEHIQTPNMPLGWSQKEKLDTQQISLCDVAFVYLATDGLLDWADRLGSSTSALAYRLLQDRKSTGGTPSDDLLLLRYQTDHSADSQQMWHPLADLYEPSDLSSIDIAATQLLRILKTVLPAPPSVDAISSALQALSPQDIKACTIAYRPVDAALRLLVSDTRGIRHLSLAT